MLENEIPESVLRGREERIRLVVDAASEGSAPAIYSLAAEAISVDASITPPGESGQPLRAGADFEWTMVATHAPQASATILVRLRRYSPEGATEAERLVLARDVVLAVRGVAGLSAPIARLAASALGLTGALLGIASFLSRTR